MLGTAALVRDPVGWSPHVGEVRLPIGGERRGAGLGRDLLEAVFAIARVRDLAKLSARMTPDQAGAIARFKSLGVRAEAMLRTRCVGATAARTISPSSVSIRHVQRVEQRHWRVTGKFS